MSAVKIICMEKLKSYRPFLLIAFLFLINIILFNHKMINLHTDFGRELLFSKMISQGFVLYRDIFNTFICPFSYLFNGFVLKFAPVNISTFYAAGAINCAIILGCIYFISRKFLNTFSSTVMTIFVMYYCCFYAGLMNFLTPYSYGIVYGLCAFLLSVFLYISFLKTDKKLFLYAAFLLAGLSAVCKYEFCLYGLFLFVFFFFKKCDIKSVLCCILSFLIFPAICAGILVLQGLNLQDLSLYSGLLKNFLQQPYLKKVYAITCYLNKYSIISSLKTFAAAFVLFALFYKLYEKNSALFKTLRRILWGFWVIAVFVYFPLTEYFSYAFWGFLTYAVLFLLLFKIKELKNDNTVLFLAGASLVVSFKSFWFLSANFYGRYFLPLLVVSLFVILKNYYFTKYTDVFEKTFCSILIFLSFCSFRLNLVPLVLKDRILNTRYGTISLTKDEEENLKPVIEYVNKNTTPSQKLVVLGNAPLLNFLTNRDSIPLYSHYDEAISGAYGAERIISAYAKSKPDYIIIFDTQDENSYCNSYGKEICKWVFENYKTEKTSGKNKAEKVYIMSLPKDLR